MNSLFMHVQKQNIAKNKKKFEAKESVGQTYNSPGMSENMRIHSLNP